MERHLAEDLQHVKELVLAKMAISFSTAVSEANTSEELKQRCTAYEEQIAVLQQQAGKTI